MGLGREGVGRGLERLFLFLLRPRSVARMPVADPIIIVHGLWMTGLELGGCTRLRTEHVSSPLFFRIRRSRLDDRARREFVCVRTSPEERTLALCRP